MRETVKAACSIAKFSNEDAFSGLPDKELLATDCPDLALYHPWQLEAKAAIALAIECETYFAKPYHSWQRGLNENHNGLLRQYFPKKTRLDTLTQHEVDFAIHEMNHRPRKSLNYKTPWEVFFEMSGQYFDSFPSVALVT